MPSLRKWRLERRCSKWSSLARLDCKQAGAPALHSVRGKRMTSSTSERGWAAIAILAARLIFLVFFGMAFSFKLLDIGGTAGYIASVGFPSPTVLAWLAVIFEVLLVLGFLTGAYFAEACLLAGLY